MASPNDAAFGDDFVTETIEESLRLLFDSGNIPQHRFYLGQTQFEYFRGVYFKKVSQLGKGSSFGELSLFSGDFMRNLTVVTETFTKGVYLSRDDFQKALSTI